VIFLDSLSDLRRNIDRLDEQIIILLRERVALAKRISKLKLQKGLPIRDNGREREVLDRVAANAERGGINPELAKKIFKEIIELCVEVQKES